MESSGRLCFETFYSALLSAASPRPSQAAAQAWWQTVHDAYDREEQRHYHTLAHITAMWDAFTQWKGDPEFQTMLSQDTPAGAVLLFAIMFHDVVYDPRASGGKNERDSESMWAECALQLNVRDDIAVHTSQLILATISHRIPDDGAHYPACLPLFLDLDLEVLAVNEIVGTAFQYADDATTQRPRDAYAAYASQIRAEYAHVSPEDFHKGRSAVLRSLSQGDIYFTAYCREHLRDAARANLKWELAQLEDAHAAD